MADWDVVSTAPAASADPWAVVSVAPTGRKAAPEGGAKEKARAAYARRQEKFGNRADNAGAAGINGMLFGNLDKMTGAMNATEVGVGNAFGRALGRQPEFTAGDAYEAARDMTREEQQRFAAEHPVSSGAANVLGSLKAPGVSAAAGYVAKAPNLISAIGRSAATGAAISGVTGASSAEGGFVDRAVAGGKSALVGGALGAGLGPLARTGQQAVGSGVTKVAKPVLAKMEAAKNAAYKAVDNAGIQYAAPAMTKLAGDIRATLDAANINPIIHPKADAAVGVVKKVAANKNLTMTQLDQLRQYVKTNIVALPDKGERAMGRMIVDQIDQFIENAQPGDLLTGDAKTASALVKTARDLNRKYRVLESVDGAVSKAKDRAASTGSGGNVDNAIRQNLRVVMEKTPGLTAQEKNAFARAVQGGRGQNALRAVGKLSPIGNGLNGILTVGATMVNPVLGVPAIGAAGSKLAADAITHANVQALRKIIAGGGPAANAAVKMAKANPALAKALTRAGVSLEAGSGVQVGRVSQPASAGRP